tara:strand:- start:2625 stop:3494 length:870 start_codon:yes stop_codon:yes gene_type:complete
MNKTKLISLIDDFYNKAINGSNYSYEPIIIIESIKSIIGIDLNTDSRNLVDWLCSYIEKFNFEDFHFIDKAIDGIEVISYKDLEQSLLNGDIPKSVKVLSYLLSVSDGTQVLENVLEIGVKHSPNSVPLIWSVYKMEMFLNKKYIFKSLQICFKSIVDNLENKSNEINSGRINWINFLKKSDFNSLILYSIYNDDLVRSDRFKKYIPLGLTGYSDKVNLNNIDFEIESKQKKNGRMWILEYINEIKCCDLSVELILKVNILRSCIKFAKDEKEELILWNRLNKVVSEVK